MKFDLATITITITYYFYFRFAAVATNSSTNQILRLTRCFRGFHGNTLA